MSLFKSASLVSLLTLASRITGLVRELLMAATFGASALTDLDINATVPADPIESFVPVLPKRQSRQEIRAEVQAAMAYERSPSGVRATE